MVISASLQGWEASSILPAPFNSVDHPAFASVKILSSGPATTADNPLGSFPFPGLAGYLCHPLPLFLGIFLIPFLPEGLISALANPPSLPKSLLLEGPAFCLRIQGVDTGWVLFPPSLVFSCPAGMRRAFHCWLSNAGPFPLAFSSLVQVQQEPDLSPAQHWAHGPTLRDLSRTPALAPWASQPV